MKRRDYLKGLGAAAVASSSAGCGGTNLSEEESTKEEVENSWEQIVLEEDERHGLTIGRESYTVEFKEEDGSYILNVLNEDGDANSLHDIQTNRPYEIRAGNPSRTLFVEDIEEDNDGNYLVGLLEK